MVQTPKSAIAEKEILYLNGFLEAVASYNSFINDTKSYYAELLPKVAGADTQETLRTHFGVKHWLITTTSIDNEWKLVLTEELRFYFGQIVTEVGHILPPDIQAETLVKLQQNQQLPIGLVLQAFIINLAELVSESAVLNRVVVNSQPEGVTYEGFYECYANDYLFEMPDHILFLHFGGSD